MTKLWGAAPEEWRHWSCELAGLGLAEDLLPLVCDPSAPISANSKLKAIGKTPSRLTDSGEVVGIPRWTELRSRPTQIEAWARNPSLGICLQTRRVRALDLDLEDGNRAQQIAMAFIQAVGAVLPRRTRPNSGKMLLLFRTEGELPKRSFRCEGGLVEFLGTGQQAVISGTHSSGVRYEWQNGLPSDIPIVPLERFERAWAKLVETFATERAHEGSIRSRGDSFDADDPVADFLHEKSLVLDEGRDGQLYVHCPRQELHSGDSGVTQSAWLIAGSAGHSEGRFHCLHASCQVTTSDFLDAIGFSEIDTAGDFDIIEDDAPAAEAPAGERRVRATPYQWRDPRELPMRPWVYGRQLLRGSLSVVVAPGATGKTALLVGTTLALATGRALLGKEVHGRPQRVWLWNLEDGSDELARLVQAACVHWEIGPDDFAERLFVDSGLDGAELCTATADRSGVKVLAPVMAALTAELKARAIDVLIVDPFVSSHRAPENDNGAIDAVAKAWARVAADANCSIVLVHHTSKMAGAEVSAEKARGASALINAARSVLALNRMTPEEANKLGIVEGDRRRYFRAYDDKNNRAPPAEVSDWFKLEGIPLGNGADPLDHGDDIQVVVPWMPPRPGDGIGDRELLLVQEVIEAGEWRSSPQSQKWAGYAIAEALALDIKAPGVRERVRQLLKGWLADGSLREEQVRDPNRVLRPCIVVGRRVGEIDVGVNVQEFACSYLPSCLDESRCTTCAPLEQTGGAPAAILHRSTPPPLGGGGGGAVPMAER